MDESAADGSVVAYEELPTSLPGSSRRGFVPPIRQTGWVNVVFILFAELVGTGILGLPHTFSTVGIAWGVTLLVVFSLASFYSGILLWRLHRLYPAGITYGNLAEQVVGRVMQIIVFVFIYIAFFGNMAIYILLCAQALQNLFYMYPEVCLPWFTVATAAVLLPLAQMRTLHAVSFAGAVSAVAICIAMILILSEAFATWPAEGEVKVVVEPTNSFIDGFSAATTAVFAFGGQGLFMETMSEMRNVMLFRRSLVFVTISTFFTYLLCSVAISARYGTGTEENALYALAPGALKCVAAFLLFAHVLVSYTLANQVICRAMHVRIAPADVNKGNWRECFQWLGITSGALAFAWLLANAVPFFGSLIGIVGAISTAPLTFGIPAVFWLKACRDKGLKIHWCERIALYAMIAIAIIITTIFTAVDLIELVRKWHTFGYPFACLNLDAA